MKKNGFIFIETIIVIVILTSALVLLYTSFSKIIQTQKTYITYDDSMFIYRTWSLRKQLEYANFKVPQRDLFRNLDGSNSKTIVTIGLDYSGLFDSNNKNFFRKMFNDFGVEQMVLVNALKLNNLRTCKAGDMSTDCFDLNNNLSDGLVSFIKTISLDSNDPTEMILVVEYHDENENSNNRYYGWVRV